MIFKKQTGILLLLLLAIGCTNTEIVIQEASPPETVPPTSLPATATSEAAAATEEVFMPPAEDMVMIYVSILRHTLRDRMPIILRDTS